MDTKKIKILQNIYKNVHKKQWKCLYPKCNQGAINSHLLQENGILNQISENSHIVELVENDYFNIAKGEKTLIFERNSINKVMSHPLFCNDHDNSVFKGIETGNIDFNHSNSQLLFSYRALCGELWKKQRNLEFYTRVKNSIILNGLLSEMQKADIQNRIDSHSLGISDLTNYKLKFEKSFYNSTFFKFKTFSIPKLEICGSGLFSPTSESESFNQKDPFPAIFVNLIPMDNLLYIIIGKSLDYTNDWIDNYFLNWERNYATNSGFLISDLIASRIESWAISPSLFEKWKPKKLHEIEVYWNINRYNLSVDQKFDTNLFSD